MVELNWAYAAAQAADSDSDRGAVVRLELVDDGLADLAAAVLATVGASAPPAPGRHPCSAVPRAPERPIGPHVDDVRLRLQAARQVGTGCCDGRVIHRAAARRHHEHDVRLPGAEAVSEEREGPAGRRRRVLEAGVAEAGEDAAADGTGHDGELSASSSTARRRRTAKRPVR